MQAAMMVSSTYRLNRPAYSLSECITQKQNRMKNKEEIRHYLDTRFSPSEDDMVQIVRNDFDRILNSAASCALITVEVPMPVLAERLRTVIHKFAPQVNIVWGCSTDAKLAETDYSILLLIGTSAE